MAATPSLADYLHPAHYTIHPIPPLTAHDGPPGVVTAPPVAAPPVAAPPVAAPPVTVGSAIYTEQQFQDRLAEESTRLESSLTATFQRKYGANISDLSELEALRTDKSERERKELEAQGNYESALQSQRDEHKKEAGVWHIERDSLLGELRQQLVYGKIISPAGSGDIKAVNAEQVAVLLSARVKMDDDTRQITVLGTDDKPWHVSGRSATIDELVEDFLKANPHMAAAAQTLPPSGSTTASTTTTSGAQGTGDEAKIAELEEQLKELEKTASTGPQSTALITQAHQINRQIKALKTKLDKKAAA